MDKRRGLYVGTEIDSKWWRRYTKEGFFARGNGEYWYDDSGFYFLRYFTKEPIFIPFNAVTQITLGTWHSGKWPLGNLILKILWKKDNLDLSSGFIVGKKRDEAIELRDTLKLKIKS